MKISDATLCLKRAIKKVGIFKLDYCSNSQVDFLALCHLSIRPIVCKPISFISMFWQPPPSGWVKVNTDGSALGSPGLLSGGGVFRNCRGLVHGCFALPLGSCYAFEAEFQAAIHAVEVALSKGWTHLWLELDSTYVVHLFHSRSSQVSWHLVADWLRCLHLVSLMDSRVAYISGGK